MDSARLTELGLDVRDAEDGLEATLELSSSQLVNPISRSFLNKVVFTVVGDRLVIVSPPEFIGLPPIHLAGVEKGSAIEAQVAEAFTEHILQLQRRSKQLQSLGISPRVDGKNLILTADVTADRFTFTIGADRKGNFRLLKASRDGADLTVAEGQTFELSEFREAQALAGYLAALFGEVLPAGEPGKRRPRAGAPNVSYAELAETFGAGATIPATTAIEVLVVVKAKGETYRFAAARVAGTTFRGMLAGPSGKVWAERFELGSFPGVVSLVADALGVTEAEIEVLGPEEL
jgi:hypothetical protein